jgi:hypothetical protein
VVVLDGSQPELVTIKCNGIAHHVVFLVFGQVS